MPLLSRGELLQVVIDACRHRTEAVLYLCGGNPFTLSIDGQETGIFVANVTHARRSQQDEFRIQCPGDLPEKLARRRANGQEVCILGYSPESSTFSAWDPSVFVQRNRITQRFSLYTRQSNQELARTNGFAIYRDSARQNVLSFRSEFLGLYVSNTQPMHRAREASLRRLGQVYNANRSGDDSRRSVMVARQRIDVTLRRYSRSHQFREAVLGAYDNRCAMCGIQLDLLEAAHLVPHAHPSGLDVVPNGIALCALHHTALDSRLIYIDEDYHVQINSVRRRYLTRIGRTEGLRRFKRQLRSTISLPLDPNELPSPANIILGNQLRGIDVE